MDTSALTEGRLEAAGWVRETVSDSPSGLVPLVVGITGHRDLRGVDREPLEAAVSNLFDELRAAHPGRPLALLTALAEGADTLVARVALAAGARLVVVLPMPWEEYERDFEGAAHADFWGLLHNRDVVRRVVIPMAGRAADRLDDKARRSVQYALAGAYIANHADVLIALWDGQPSDRVGGTAHVVHYRRSGVFEVDAATAACLADVAAPFGLHDDLLAPPRIGFVHHIVTPRREHQEVAAPFARTILAPLPAVAPAAGHRHDTAEAYAESVADVDAQIHEFNDEARALELAYPGDVDACAAALYVDPESGPGEASSSLPSGLASLRRSFALADALANRYQRRLIGALVWIFALIFVGGVAFALFTHEFATWGFVSSPAAVIGYVGLVGLANAIFVVVKWKRWQDRYQDRRAIAEGLRVQFYWRLAGIDHAASDYYVRHQRDELAWIPRVARACGVVAPSIDDDRLDDVRTHWAERQATYYSHASVRARRNLRWRHAGSGALGASLLIGLALAWRVSSEWPWVTGGLIPAAALLLLAPVVIELTEPLWGDRTASGRASDRLNVAAQAAGFFAALGVMLVMVNIPLWIPRHPEWIPSKPAQWLVLSLGVTGLAAGLLHAYSQVRAFAEHARRYGQLASIFGLGAERLQTALDADDGDRCRATIFELGKEALNDHGDWVILHRERPLEVPEGGG